MFWDDSGKCPIPRKLLAFQNVCSLRELSTSCSLFKDKKDWKGKGTQESSSSDSSSSDSDEEITAHETDKITLERDDARLSDSKTVLEEGQLNKPSSSDHKTEVKQKGNDSQSSAQAGAQKGNESKKKKKAVFAQEGQEMTRSQLDEAIVSAAKSVAEELQGDTEQIHSQLLSKVKSQMKVTAAQKMGEPPKHNKTPLVESESEETADSKKAPQKPKAKKPVVGTSLFGDLLKDMSPAGTKSEGKLTEDSQGIGKQRDPGSLRKDLLKDMSPAGTKSEGELTEDNQGIGKQRDPGSLRKDLLKDMGPAGTKGEGKLTEDSQGIGNKETREDNEREFASRILYVTNFPAEVTEDQLKALSKDIKGVKVLKGSKGMYAFLEFESEEMAKKNFTSLSKAEVQGQKIIVNYRITSGMETKGEFASRTLYVTHLPAEVTEDQLKALSKDIKGVQVLKGSKGIYAFLEFESEEMAKKNFTSLSKAEVQGQKIIVNYRMIPGMEIKGEKAKRNLYVTHLPADTTVKELMALSKDIKGVRNLSKSRGLYAFLDFESEEVAQKNFESLRGAEIKGQKIIVEQTRIISKESDGEVARLIVKNLPPQFKEDDLEALSEDIKGIKIAEGTSGWFAFLEFESKEVARKNLASLQAAEVLGQKILVENAEPSRRPDAVPYELVTRSLHVTNLPDQLKETELKEELTALSTDIQGVNVLKGSAGRFAFLEFESEEMAQKNWKSLRWAEIQGKPLRVGFRKINRKESDVDSEDMDQFERPRMQRGGDFDTRRRPQMGNQRGEEFDRDVEPLSKTGFTSTGEFTGEGLGIFSPEDLQAVPEVTGENKLFNQIAKEMEEEMITVPPSNAFQEQIQWTKQGKLWKFPIDNEQGWEEEANVSFEEHVFLEDQLEGFPQKGPVRHFMELVTTALSKNPYLTVAQKREHIDWFRDYFEEKKTVIEENIEMDFEDQAVELQN